MLYSAKYPQAVLAKLPMLFSVTVNSNIFPAALIGKRTACFRCRQTVEPFLSISYQDIKASLQILPVPALFWQAYDTAAIPAILYSRLVCPERFCKRRHYLVQVADDPIIRHVKNRRIRIFIDSNDGIRAGNAGKMLDCP